MFVVGFGYGNSGIFAVRQLSWGKLKKRLQFLMSVEWWAKLATSLYVSSVLIYIGWKWFELKGLPANELGDFLAGAFGPLAFMWLMLSYRQQGKAVQDSNTAFAEQLAEMRKKSEQDNAMLDPALEIGYECCLPVNGVQVDVYSLHSTRNECQNLVISFISCTEPPHRNGPLIQFVEVGKIYHVTVKTLIQDVRVGSIVASYVRMNGSRGELYFT